MCFFLFRLLILTSFKNKTLNHLIHWCNSGMTDFADHQRIWIVKSNWTIYTKRYLCVCLLFFTDVVKALEDHVITKVCCGSSHSVAINEWGNVYTWGSNSFSQLGQEGCDSGEIVPKLVKALGTKQIVQIACGEYHTIALTNGKTFARYSLWKNSLIFL